MIVIGLTGSIAMGKSTAAALFAEFGVPVCESDAIIHDLYAKGGAAVAPIANLFPDAVMNGAINRGELAEILGRDPSGFAKLEAIAHPLVRNTQDGFLRQHRAAGAAIVVLDIPLLFETGRDRDVDKIVVVSAPEAVQRERALARPGMTEEKLALLLSRQIPDSEKRRRADFVVDSGQGIDRARAQIRAILVALSPNQGP
ncbi:dephospho-CoA kinase [soil metagenome]